MGGVANVGVNTFRNVLLTNTAVAVHPSRTLLFHVHGINPNTTDIFLQLYDVAAASVTVGTTTPTQTFLLPGGSGASNRGAFAISLPAPIQFSTALSIAVTTTITGGSAPGSEATVNIGYLAG